MCGRRSPRVRRRRDRSWTRSRPPAPCSWSLVAAHRRSRRRGSGGARWRGGYGSGESVAPLRGPVYIEFNQLTDRGTMLTVGARDAIREVTPDEVAFYRQHGWVKLDGLVHPDVVAQML